MTTPRIPALLAAAALALTACGVGTTGSTGDCTEAVANGATVTLTATPDAGSIFKSWSTGCASVSGTSCTVSMTTAKSVMVMFDYKTQKPVAIPDSVREMFTSS